MRRALAVAAGVLGIVAGVTCSTSQDTLTGPAATLHSIAVSPDTSTLVTGATRSFTAQPKDASGKPVVGVALVWASSDTTIATVTQAGVVTARAPGSVQIAASAFGINGLATVTVVQIPVASIIVAPPIVIARVGTTVQLSDTLKDSVGNVLTGRTLTWASDSTPAASVDQTGLVTAKALGVAHISATIAASAGQPHVTGHATITVTLTPVFAITIIPQNPSVFVAQTTQLFALPTDSIGNPLSGRVITWSSDNTGVATISNAGLVTGVAAGSATIQATCEGKTTVTTVTVSNVPLSAVVLSPANFGLTTGQTQQLSAQVYNAQGQLVTGAPVTYTSKNTGVATVSSTGLVTGVGAGTDTISAASGGVTGIAVVTVTLAPVASVTIVPPLDTLLLGAQVTLQATPRDGSGNVITGRPVTWGTSNPGVATVSPVGQVLATGTGVAVITATIGGVPGNATIVVNPVPIASVTITPPKVVTVVQGAQHQLSVTVTDQNGHPVANPSVTWTSTANNIATVSGTGLVLGVSPGTAKIAAASGGKSDTATVTVQLVPVASVVLSPNPATVVMGTTVTLTATVKDASNNTLSNRKLTWSSNNTGIATVNGDTLETQIVTGQALGSATITAVSPDGPSGAATVNVVAVPVATVTVAPSDTTITTAQTAQMRVTLKDSHGNVLSPTNYAVVWSSTPSGRIDASSGLFTPQSSSDTGAFTVTAASGGQQGAARVHVTLVPIATVTATPSPLTVTLGPGWQQTLSVVVKDAQGHTLNRPVTWSSLNSGIASVSPSGGNESVLGVAVGTTSVVALADQGLFDAKADTVPVTVVQANIASIVVTPNPAAVNVGGTVTLAAALKDAKNNVLTNRTLSWGTSDATVASINGATDESQIVTGQGGGTATITATSTDPGNASGTATVNVGDPVDHINVHPNPITIRQTYAVATHDTAYDVVNHPLTGVTLNFSTDGTAASVNGAGVVTGTSAGTDNFTAAAQGKQKQVPITVLADSVSTININQTNPSTPYNATVNLTATIADSTGKVPPGATITWSSNPAGRVSPTTGGSTTVTPQASDTTNGIVVTATSEGKQDQTTVQVTPVTAASVSVAPTRDSAGLNGTPVSLTATARDAGNHVLNGRTIAWSIDNTQIGQLSAASGLSPSTITVTPGGPNSGATTVRATVDGHQAVAAFSVFPQDTILQQNVSLSASGTNSATLTATLRNPDGTFDTGATVTWTDDEGTLLSYVPSPSPNDGAGNSSTTVTITGTPLTTTTIHVTATSSGGEPVAHTTITVSP